MDSLEKRIRVLFAQCRRNEQPQSQSDLEFNNIRKDYYKVLEDADEKVQLASQMYDLVERVYLRKLDSELYKFKCELEADHNGITEILEKRSLELDQSTNSSNSTNQKENRYFGVIGTGGSSVSGSGVSSSQGGPRERKHGNYKYKPEKRRDSVATGGPSEKRHAMSNSVISTPTAVTRPSTPNLNHHSVIPSTPTTSNVYGGIADKAIAAAASQAIVATQQGIQGRRTASFKSSFEAIYGPNAGSAAAELLIGRELAGATHNAIQAVERESFTGGGGNRNRPNKKKLNLSSAAIGTPSTSTSALSLAHQNSQIATPILPSTPTLPQTPDPPSLLMNENGLVTEQTPEGEWTYDPNEPRYCICNQVSYGDMVACDNEDCPFEWFHYPCVGITQSPKGKWYCPQCTSSLRRRGSRKN